MAFASHTKRRIATCLLLLASFTFIAILPALASDSSTSDDIRKTVQNPPEQDDRASGRGNMAGRDTRSEGKTSVRQRNVQQDDNKDDVRQEASTSSTIEQSTSVATGDAQAERDEGKRGRAPDGRSTVASVVRIDILTLGGRCKDGSIRRGASQEIREERHGPASLVDALRSLSEQTRCIRKGLAPRRDDDARLGLKDLDRCDARDRAASSKATDFRVCMRMVFGVVDSRREVVRDFVVIRWVLSEDGRALTHISSGDDTVSLGLKDRSREAHDKPSPRDSSRSSPRR